MPRYKKPTEEQIRLTEELTGHKWNGDCFIKQSEDLVLEHALYFKREKGSWSVMYERGDGWQTTPPAHWLPIKWMPELIKIWGLK